MPMPACKGCTKHSACGHSDDVWYFKGCALNDASASAAVVVPCRCSCGCSLLLLLLLFFFFLTRVVGINLSHGKRDRFLFGTHLQQCRELLCEILLAYSTASKGVSLWQNGSGSARKGGASLSPAQYRNQRQQSLVSKRKGAAAGFCPDQPKALSGPAATTRLQGPARGSHRPLRPETGSPRTFIFSLENAVCKDSYRRQCRK